MADVSIHGSRDQHPGQGVALVSGAGAGCEGCLSQVMEGFSGRFERSAKRWELVVYPSLFAFIVLATYGFFLIYSLTSDMRTMAMAMDPRMGVNMAGLSSDMHVIASGMVRMTENVSTMSEDVRSMKTEMQRMTPHVAGMDSKVDTLSRRLETMTQQMSALGPMVVSMHDMNQSMRVMTGTVSSMGRDMNVMSRPMGLMSSFMPLQ